MGVTVLEKQLYVLGGEEQDARNTSKKYED